MKKKVRLSDIAEKLNLSKVSVSKALRDHPDISDKRKKEVKEMALKIGYRPNLIARSLTSYKTKTLGVVVPKIAHNFFAHIVAGIQQVASEHDYKIVLMVSEESAKLEKQHIEVLVSMQVDGLLTSISMETENYEIFETIREMQVPLVFFDRHVENMGFNSVIVDDENVSHDGVSRLIKKGHTKIAHLAGYQQVNIGKYRRIGYERALKEKGLKVDPSYIIEGGFDEKSGYDGFKKLLTLDNLPDAIFAVTFPVALGVYFKMREVDPSLIDSIPVLSVGDTGLNGLIPYPQYYIEQNPHVIGERAADLLLKEIRGEIKPENHIEIVDTQFIETENRKTFLTAT